MNKFRILFGMVLIAVTNCNSQTIAFQKTFFSSGTGPAQSLCIRQTPDGGYIQCGYSNDSLPVLIRTGQAGNILWSKEYAIPGALAASYVERTKDQGYFFAGSILGSLSEDYYIVKTDSSGNVLWNKVLIPSNWMYSSGYYGMGAGLIGVRARQTEDSGYVMLGQVSDTVSSYSWFEIIRLDKFGNLLWSKDYDSNNKSELYEIELAPSETGTNGFIVTAEMIDPNSTNYMESVLLTRLDDNGNIIWSKTYYDQNAYAQGGYSVKSTSDHGWLVTGRLTSMLGSGMDQDILAMKTDSNGAVIWSWRFNNGSINWGNSVYPTSDNGAIVGGSSMAFDTTTWASIYNDAVLLKLDAGGNLQWSKRYGKSSENEDAISVIQTLDGGYAFCGQISDTINMVPMFMYFVKTDVNGSSGCNDSNFTITQKPVSFIAVNTASNFSTTITGSSVSLSGQNIILSSISCGISDVNELNSGSLFQVFPNPSSGQFNLILDRSYCSAKIEVVDVTGRTIYSSKFDGRSNSIDLRETGAGIYFLHVRCGNRTHTEKIIIN